MEDRPVEATDADPGGSVGRRSEAGRDSRPGEFEPRVLARRGLPALIALLILVLVALLAPGLGEVRELLGGADLRWVAAAIALEALSFASYIVMFAPIFRPEIGWRRSWEIGGSELAVGSLVPASGLGGLALGAWVLHEGGMEPERIARRSVAFFLIKSSVNFLAVAVIGTLMFCGLFGPSLSWALTLLPAALAAALIAAVIALPRLGPGREPGAGSPRTRRWLAATRRALVAGVATSVKVVRSGNLRVIGGSVGYWAFDNAVLWASFRALGQSPDIAIVLIGYLIGQLGGLLPIPGGIGGIDGGLIGTLVVYGAPAALVAAAVLLYRVILFWLPLLLGAVSFFSLRANMPESREFAAAAR